MARLISKKYVTPVSDLVYDITVDETHNYFANDVLVHNCSMSSLQGKQIFRIKKECKEQIQWIPMTGTPIVSKPTDVFLPLRLVDGHNYSSWYLWRDQY